jgi:hypothetical protein
LGSQEQPQLLLLARLLLQVRVSLLLLLVSVLLLQQQAPSQPRAVVHVVIQLVVALPRAAVPWVAWPLLHWRAAPDDGRIHCPCASGATKKKLYSQARSAVHCLNLESPSTHR